MRKMKLKQYLLTYSVALFISLVCTESHAKETKSESDLHNVLFKDYCKQALPSRHTRTLIKIQFHFTNLVAFDSRKQTVTISGWFNFSWTDPRLSWEPEEFQNITTLFVRKEQIWKPDLIQDKDAREKRPLGWDDQLALVQCDGVVIWAPGNNFVIPCPLSLTQFPFDSQTCNLSLTTWMHTSAQLEIQHTSQVGLDVYAENEEWSLVRSKMTSYDTYDVYVGAKIILEFKRKPHFYLLILIIPIVFASLLNCFVFLLPPESGERITLSITTFLSFTVFISYVSEIVPKNAESVPLIAVLLVIQSAISVISLILNILIVRLDHTNENMFLKWIRKCSSREDSQPQFAKNRQSQRKKDLLVDQESNSPQENGVVECLEEMVPKQHEISSSNEFRNEKRRLDHCLFSLFLMLSFVLCVLFGYSFAA